MSQVSLRLEKAVPAKAPNPAHVAYVEFRHEPGNSVGRFWNIYKNGRPVQQKEKEIHQSPEAVRAYVKNMRALYESQGFKAVSGEWLAITQADSVKSPRGRKPRETVPPTTPVASKSGDLGALPPGAALDE